MKNGVKKELAAASGFVALIGWSRRSPFWTALFTSAAVGFYLSSLEKNSVYGKKVYITGGSRGLGLSLAWNLLERGVTDVTLVARDEDELVRAREILKKDYADANIHVSVCDVTETYELEDSLNQAVERMHGIDLLINNAGAILVGPLSSMQKIDFQAQIKIHLYAAVESMRLIVPYFKRRGGGQILNICSLGGKVAIPHMSTYDASKFALAGFSQAAAAELSQHNICVTTAYPSVMRTGSAIQAVFKGNHEKEFEWFETLDNLPLLSTSADTAAKKIINAVEQQKAEVILSIPGKTRVFLGALFPEISHSLMGWIATLLPRGDSLIRKTGAESNLLFKKSFWLKPLQATVKKAEDQYNQKPDHSAEYNLGL